MSSLPACSVARVFVTQGETSCARGVGTPCNCSESPVNSSTLTDRERAFEIPKLSDGCRSFFVSLPPACVLVYGASSASAELHYDARCWCLRMSHCAVRAWVSAPHVQLDTVGPASADSLTAGVTPASVRTRDRRTDARTGHGPFCPRNGKPHPGFPGVSGRHASWPPTKRPSSGRLPERGGDGTPRRVLGSDQPQLSSTPTPLLHRRGYPTVAPTHRTAREWTQRESPIPACRPPPRKGTDDNRTATVCRSRGVGCCGCAGTAGYLLRDCGSVGPQPLPMSFYCAVMTQSLHTLLMGRAHACAFGQKTTRGHQVVAFPSLCAPQKVEAGSEAVGGHRRVATRKATGVPATHRGAGDPACE